MDRSTNGGQSACAAIVEDVDIRSVGRRDVGSGNRKVVRNAEVKKSVPTDGAASVADCHTQVSAYGGAICVQRESSVPADERSGCVIIEPAPDTKRETCRIPKKIQAIVQSCEGAADVKGKAGG